MTKLILFVGLLLLVSCKKEDLIPIGEPGTFTDVRDGHTYRTVMLGAQTWMAQNLQFDVKDTSASIYRWKYHRKTGFSVRCVLD